MLPSAAWLPPPVDGLLVIWSALILRAPACIMLAVAVPTTDTCNTGVEFITRCTSVICDCRLISDTQGQGRQQLACCCVVSQVCRQHEWGILGVATSALFKAATWSRGHMTGVD
jgi:hypothetical protein